MSEWAFWRRRRLGPPRRTHSIWCPFINQTELVARLFADLAAIRDDPTKESREPAQQAAVAALDAWICIVVDHLRDRTAETAELDVTVTEWRRRRSQVGLNPENADVLAVAD